MSGLSAHATTLAATQSPLDKLVRQQSKRARGSPYASPPQVVVSQPSSSQAFGYGPHASYQSASSTLDSPASSQTPHSPLLHTRFGNTQRYSDLSETSSYAPSDDIDGDGHRPFSHLTAVGPAARSGLESASPDGGPPSPTPSSPGAAALGVPLPPPARHSDVDPFAFRSYESQPPPSGRVPIVAAARSDEGHGQRQSQHRVASQLSVSSAEAVQPRLNFSRPIRRQPADQPPPVPAPAPSQPPPAQQQQHNPYMRPPQPEPDSSPQSSFSFPPKQQPQQQQSFQFPPAKQQQPFQFPPKQPPAPAFQSQSHSHIRSPSVRDDDGDDDEEAGLAYASPDPGQELFGGGQAKGSRDRHPYAYVSGAPSNYEYDEGASPVEISPLTPTPHQYAGDAQHTPWAISPERRRTLPPGFDMRAAAGAATGELSPISDESETAMREHAAAFTLDPRERWEEEASPLPEGSYDDPGPVRFADSPRMAPRALYDEPRSPPQQQSQRAPPPPQPRFEQPRYNDMQQRFEDPRAAPHPHAQHRYTESSSTIRGGEDPPAPAPRTEAQRYRDELQMREREREHYDQPQAQAQGQQRPYSPQQQQRGYDPQMAYCDQRPYDAQQPQHPQSLYPGQQGQRPRNDSSPRQPPQQMLYRDEQQRPYGSPREQPGQMYQDGPQRAFDSPQAYAGSPQGAPRPYTPQQQGYSNMNSPGPQSALSPQSANSQRPHSPYSPNMQQQQQQQPRSRSPIPPRGPSPHPPPVYPLPTPGETYPDSHTQPQSRPQEPPARVQSPSQFQQPPPQFAQQHPQIPPPPPEPADAPAMSRADKGISYYSTQSQYFPPPSAHPAQHVQLPAAPPSPNFGRPGSRNSVYSNYSYYAIPSPTGSGTPTEERFGSHLAPTASGRETPMQMGQQQRSASPQAQGKKQGPVTYDAYGRPMQGPGQASGSGSSGERGFAYQQQQGRPPPPQPPQGQHGREVSEAPTLRAARDVLGRTSEETIREHPEKRGWFGRRERRPSHESSGRRSPTGSAHSHRQYVATLPNPSPGTLRADSAQEYLTLGIAAHEALRLAESAYCFEQAATFRGGCAVGMLMWGLALRHAWGVRKDEKEGFKWLRRAAGRAVEGLEMAYSGKDSKEGKGELEGVKTELVLAIYEVGQCFFHGWGVVTDKKMAVSYYQVAARLGDSDAQQALAFCYANGRGTKKDLKESAKWYRAAAAQGASTVGLAWIYKTKYGAEEDADGRPAQR